MKKPKFNAACVNRESTIFDELLKCYSSTNFYFFIRTDTQTHLQHLWRTIFFSVAWVAIVLCLSLYVKFLPNEVIVCLLITIFFIPFIVFKLKRYVYYDGHYIPHNVYRRKLIENFISSHTTDYPRLANQLIQICKEQSNSENRAITIALISSLVTLLAIVFNFVILYVYDGYKEFLHENNCRLFEPQALETFKKMIYMFLILLAGFFFQTLVFLYMETSSDKMRIITKYIQESLLEREFRDETK